MATKKNTDSKSQAPATPRPNLTERRSVLASGYFPYALIFLIAFVLYGNTLMHDYALDDSIVITSNSYTKEGNFGKIFSTDAFEGFFGGKRDLVEGGRYRPLSIATFAVEWAISPNNPSFSHFNNIFLYALCGMLLFIFLRQIFPEKDPVQWWFGVPFILTLLYLVHPIHTEVVANIKGRDELMALLFLLGGMIAAFKYIDNKQPFWLPIAFLSFFLGLMSKETPLPFVAILPLTIVFFRRASILQNTMASLPFLLATGAYLGIRFSVLGTDVGGTGSGTEILNDPFLFATKSDRAATVIQTWGMYLIKLFAPIQLSHDYYFNQIPITNFGSAAVEIALTVNLALLGLGIWLGIKRNPIGYGILFYFISFSITSNLIVSIGTTMGERFVFVPSLGFLIAVVFAVKALAEKLKIKDQRLAVAAVLIVAVTFTGRTILRNQVWKDNFTLFTNDAKISPNSAKVRTAAGGVMIERVDEKGVSANEKSKLLRDAIAHLNAAVKIYPEHGNAWLLLGNAYHKLDDYNNSLISYQNAMNFRPLLWDAYKNAQITARKVKRFDLASTFYKLELDRKTSNGVAVSADYWFDRANNYEEWGLRPDSAIWAYGVALEKDPKMAKAYGQMGRVYGMQLRDYDHAVEFGEKALTIDPKLDWVYENVGIANAMQNDFPGAIAAFQRGLQLFPKSAKLYLNLALTYQNMGDQVNAGAAFAKAFELDPSLKR
jgi:tetratricopeptide (TPR) repeat protein